MRTSTLLVIGALMLACPAIAQTLPDVGPKSPPQASSRAGSDPSSPGASRAEGGTRSPGAPVDQGPSTPEANQAHRGGGAVLEGAPGAPAPPPLPTPAHDALPAR